MIKIVQRSIRRAVAICGTQELLAKKAGLSQQAIGKYLYSNSIPKAPTALRLSKAVNGELTPADFAPDAYAGLFPMTTILED
jgi:transcriptional regulator with XRE-family HTH domain